MSDIDYFQIGALNVFADLLCDCIGLEVNFIECFRLLHEYRGEYMVLMSYAVTVRGRFGFDV